MKPIPLLLVQVLLVVVGLVAYDQLRGAPAPAPTDVERLEDDVNPPAAPGLGPAGPAVVRGGQEWLAINARMSQLEDRMKGLEGLFNEIAALQKGNLAGGDGASRGLLDGRDLEAVEKGTYNEATMNVLRMYLNEVERRRQVEQREGLFTREITSRNIPLPADQREAVVKAFIEFQDEALELIRGREEGGLRNARELAQADFEAHRERFHAKVREMVGNEVAEKLFTIRTMQTAGFFHGPDDEARNKDPRKDGR